MRGNQGWVAPAPSSIIPPAPGVLRRCAARRRSPPSLTSVDSSCDLRPATCDLQPATLTGVAYAGRSGVGSSPSSVPLPRMMFACDALRPPPSPAAPLTPPPSPTAPPNPPPCLGRLRCLLFMAVLSVHRRLAPLVRSRRGLVRGRGRREQRASRVHAACGPPLSSPFDEHSRGNQDAIMIRVLSHRWHSAGEESDRYSVRSSRAARETACAAQAQEREQRCVSTPSRHSRGGERHAREGGQPPLSRASSTRRAPACAARVCKQEQQRVSMPSQRSRGDERHAREGNQLRKSRAASGILRPRTRAGAAA